MGAGLERSSVLENQEVLPEEKRGSTVSAAVTDGREGRVRLDHVAQHQGGQHKPGQRPSWWSLIGEGHSWEIGQGMLL